MRADNIHTDEPPLFSAVLTPYRSLAPMGFTVVILMIAGLSALLGLIFVLMGAWPVIGFLGLDVLLVYWALRASYRSGQAYEQVILTPSLLSVRAVSAQGAVQEWRANPLWVRIDREELGEFGLQRLFLVSRGERLAVGNCLDPQARASFAAALSRALGEARRGPTRNPLP